MMSLVAPAGCSGYDTGRRAESMNHLFHFVTAGAAPDIVVGSIMGDFVKGRLEGGYPDGVLRGLRLHRAVDSFAAGSVNWQRSRRRLDVRFGLYRGILVDIYYDHFLARDWEKIFASPYRDYLQLTRETLEARREELPQRLGDLLPRMFDEWLPVYPEVAGIDEVLKRMSRRLSRQNPLAAGAEELERHYEALAEDFTLFFPEVMRFAEEFLDKSIKPLPVVP